MSTRWRVRRDELDAFVAQRLLSTDTDHGTAVIGVAHEAFLSAWPPLAQRSAEVEHAATEWNAHRRPRVRLWAGDQLTAAVADPPHPKPTPPRHPP